MKGETDVVLKWIRRIGWLVGGYLLYRALFGLMDPPPGEPVAFRVLYSLIMVGLGILIVLPYGRFGKGCWRRCFVLLILTAIGFGMLTVVSVVFAYLEAARAGGRLGLPAFEGTLLFVTFIQIPVVFFQRHPEEWE
ncbi:MAG: hypothetical protein ACFCU4_08130 [Puniceicoccaceae bacterium]